MDVPLFLDVAGRRIVCVGAGPVASRKVLPLAAAGARVTVIAPTVQAQLAEAAELVQRRPFAAGDVAAPDPDAGHTMLAVAATGVTAVDDAVQAEADAAGVWCLRTTGRSAVRVPSVIRSGGVTLALATGAPALTRELREELTEVVSSGWDELATVLSTLREDPHVRAALAELPEAKRRDRWRAAVALLRAHPPSQATQGQAAARAQALLEGR